MFPSSADEADQLARRLQTYIVGDDGSASLARSFQRTAELTVPHKLKSLLNETEQARTLWVSGTYSNWVTDPARTMALAFVAAAWKTGALILSHFCDLPPNKSGSAPSSLDAEQQAALGMVYSLISQLLQYPRSAQTNLDLSDARYERLQCDASSWQDALDLLRQLLVATPAIQYCMIYGMNSIEWAAGAPWLRDILDILFRHQRQQTTRPFHILLVTSGQSRLLGTEIEGSDRHMIQDGDAESE